MECKRNQIFTSDYRVRSEWILVSRSHILILCSRLFLSEMAFFPIKDDQNHHMKVCNNTAVVFMGIDLTKTQAYMLVCTASPGMLRMFEHDNLIHANARTFLWSFLINFTFKSGANLPVQKRSWHLGVPIRQLISPRCLNLYDYTSICLDLI